MMLKEEYDGYDEEDDKDRAFCNCPYCACKADVQSLGDVCMNCSSGEHWG